MTSEGHQEDIDIAAHMALLGQQARKASGWLRSSSTGQRNAALAAMADELSQQRDMLMEANARDMARGRDNGLSEALMDRLLLTPARVDAMIAGLETVAALPDPIGGIDEMRTQNNGLRIGRMRTPLGVIGIIYESRPNVTVDAAALCLKAGNAAILRGGSEAFESNCAIARCIASGLEKAGLPGHAIQLIETTSREAVGALITARDYVDVIIPRGGKSLIQRISEQASIPVIKHLEGLCHVFVDRHASLDMAAEIAFNAKCFRYGICGAMETLLVDQPVAEDFLPAMVERFQKAGVTVRGCDRVQKLADVEPATEEDWLTEYLGPVLSIRVVDDIEVAIEHINHYGSHHTDAIVSDHFGHAQRFLAEVDSSSVMVNAPTCFADGAQYGLGAEIGISTDKLHVRGPVGLEGLTTRKYIVLGDGHVRT
ncbi:glutamate-5-semialdehyde dehydrogenase [Kushneria marisflavi]|uniref:Gamma-glutamyl phosphate reductase n=1 Tax=Kushneria marisflavi TaxID=157779 RepID=A0A240UK39_9GAMM|nr:glutamate-5-semialdehyde dehydrogenase [Kushneria marisflavi]ART61864.1 glutamate-5-semialdehyde dehydrogenase [Kushneria marisflavi]RKD86907.1 glutamate-5-semialdehyde dehydrogenase [Kushneria marisflavi]